MLQFTVRSRRNPCDCTFELVFPAFVAILAHVVLAQLPKLIPRVKRDFTTRAEVLCLAADSANALQHTPMFLNVFAQLRAVQLFIVLDETGIKMHCLNTQPLQKLASMARQCEEIRVCFVVVLEERRLCAHFQNAGARAKIINEVVADAACHVATEGGRPKCP